MQPEKMKPSRFPETRWSLVGRASGSDELTRQQALAELLQAYTPGLRSFLVEVRRVSPDLADDLLHDFIADKFLARKLVHHAEQGKGKFRNFVLKSLNNFVTSKLKREYATRAVGAGLDGATLAAHVTRPGSDRFEQEWVQQVVQDAMRLMEVDCRDRSRKDLWTVFCLRVADPMLQDAEPASYEDVVRQLGIQTPRQAMNLLANAKRLFNKHLRFAVGRYVHEDQIDAEIADLREIVGR
ncbi:MAG: hypothetical protein JJU36_06730 [Phycisphaeraceae bacterium]|nr:hypothetical protein [Phycisphaeraceae bacterium]